MGKQPPVGYRLGSPLACIAGIAERTLEHPATEAELRADLRAIRELALGALAAEETEANLGAKAPTLPPLS
jgi:hypothetical protein